MNKYPNAVKKKLMSLVREMSALPSLFIKNPEKDFTRERKLPFETMLRVLLSMGGNSICKELMRPKAITQAQQQLLLSSSRGIKSCHLLWNFCSMNSPGRSRVQRDIEGIGCLPATVPIWFMQMIQMTLIPIIRLARMQKAIICCT